MTCNIEPTPENRICEFRASYALNSFMTGSVKFVDCECMDGDCSDDPQSNAPCCEQFCRPVCVGIDSSLETDCITGQALSELQDCYDDPPKWLNGLMVSHGYSVQESISTLGVVPYSDYLQNKPINTQNFCGSSLGEVIPIVLQYYGGLSPDVFCIDDGNGGFNFDDQCTIKGPIEGNNTLVELAKLAQAGCASLFTQVGGKLTIEPWKDYNSPTEFEIPCEYICKAEKAEFIVNRTTGIRMRGASIASQDCGDNSLTNNENGPGPH